MNVSHLERERPEHPENLRLALQKRIDGMARSRLVSEAFRRVDRSNFIPEGCDPSLAYVDDSITLEEEGASISQPTLTALMIDCLGLTGKEKVLEIGTGSGYSAAVLSLCASEVHTIEYSHKLSQSARERLNCFAFDDDQVHCSDGALGLQEHAPYDGIIVTAGTSSIPATLVEQLAPLGRLVIPVGRDPRNQRLIVGIKYPDQFLARIETNVVFFPLMSEEQGGWTEGKIQRALAFKKMIYLESARLQHGLSEDDVIREQAEKMKVLPESFNLDSWLEIQRFPEEAWGQFEKYLRQREANHDQVTD